MTRQKMYATERAYNGAGKLSTVIIGERTEALRKVRKMLTEMEFELMSNTDEDKIYLLSMASINVLLGVARNDTATGI